MDSLKLCCPVLEYANKVISGEIIAGNLVKLACQRHLDDLATGYQRGLYFDYEEVVIVIEFFENFLHHSKGEWAGQKVELSLWQKFRLGSIFGWKRADGFRRFRTAYNQVARKNGKTTEAAGVGLYGLIADGEPGAEIYSAATTKEQAKLVFDEASRMVAASSELGELIETMKGNLSVSSTYSKFEPLASEDRNLDGLNIHIAIVDELHAHPTRAVWDVLGSAVGARRQPLMYVITTAGMETTGNICFELYEHAKKILEGIVVDDSFFAYISQPDEGDDPEDPVTWMKANPNLGVSVYPDMLATASAQAVSMPSALNNFLVKHLNIFTSSISRWILPKIWNANVGSVNEEELVGCECYGAIDLSSTLDLSAFVLAFPVNGKFKILAKMYLPEDGIEEREKQDRVPYRLWAKQGYLTLTPGDFIDYEYIKRDILEAAEKYDLKELAFDPYKASMLTTALADEAFELVFHRQGTLSMNPSTTTFMELLMAKKIEHGDNKLLGWNADNVVIFTDSSGNIKPDKAKSRKRIDGIVATIMAVGRAALNANETANARGLIELDD